MTPRIRLVLLGDAIAYDGDEAIRCSSRKAFALFAYLALQRRAHSRKSLAALFWGRRDAEAARASLRATLFRLPAPLSACVAIERDSLALVQPVTLDCDVTTFELLAHTDDVARLREAAALYRGHLLQDFDAEATPEFDDWLDGERVRLKQAAYDCFDRLIAMHFATDASASRTTPRPASDEAIALAQRWLAMDAAAERAHRWLIRSYVDSGRGDAAQAQYELCQRALAVAEGRAPAPETHALLASLTAGARTDAPGASTAPRPRGDGLAPPSVASTSFVGRVEEIAELARLLGDPACRLVTLHGLGGVGKTRLAHAVASQLASSFANGATWVSLEGVERPDVLADTMARSLGLDVGPRVAARNALIEALRGQERLIVVDNFEQLLASPVDDPSKDPVDVLLALLREAPRVRVIVTSRQTLGVQEEWVYALEGLAHSTGNGDAPGTATSPPAIELFAQRARQAYLGFSPLAEMPHVASICARVDGLPLGIELAAAWVRTVPCAEIARELERGLDLPPGEQRNRPERQRSLRAVIEFSWRLIPSEQQDVLAALSEFRGGFTRDAAEHVAKASLRALSALVDKALVRRSSDSRFSLHPLVRAFASEKLAVSRGRRALARARHSSYYLRLLCGQRSAMYGPQHLQARATLADDLDNVRAAWEAAVEDGDASALREAAHPLCVIFDRLGLYDEWTRTFDHALASFGGDSTVESRATTLRLLVAAANGHWRRGDATRANAHRERLLAALDTASDASERAELHKLCGLIEREAGDFDAALSHFRDGTAAAKAAGDTISQTHLENEVGIVHFRRGDLEAARASFLASLSMNTSTGNVYDLPTSLHNVAYCDLELGRYDDADTGLRKSLAAYRERGDARGQAMALSSLGILARRRGDYERALEHGQASLALAERTANRGAVADASDDLARVLDKLGRRDEARALYARALAMARELGQVHLQCFVLLHLAHAEAADGAADASARSLDEALRLACEHDFQAGRLMGILGAATLRLAAADAAAVDEAAAWCRAALAEAGSNMDVRDAAPDIAPALLDVARHPLPERAVDEALAAAMAFVAKRVSGEARAQAPP